MNWYPFAKPLLFKLDPERAHYAGLRALTLAPRFLFPAAVKNPVKVMGIDFNNSIGLAAGFDRNADYLKGIAKLGFGFIEIGTVTKRPQEGNPKPRIFRIPEANALINRIGFASKGLDYVLAQLERYQYPGVLGINIGKNKTTSLDDSIEEYSDLFKAVYPHATYITINISSPNTEGLRDLQHGEYLSKLLEALKKQQAQCQNEFQKHVPCVVKVAPDLSSDEIEAMANLFLKFEIDGVIATNTTISRDGVDQYEIAHQKGGLSGEPLFNRSNQVIKQFHKVLQDEIPIIGLGGIQSKQQAQDKLAAGAKLLQIYTGLIYQGPRFISELAAF